MSSREECSLRLRRAFGSTAAALIFISVHLHAIEIYYGRALPRVGLITCFILVPIYECINAGIINEMTV